MKQGERMNFESMKKADLVKLLTEVREGLFGIEEAESALLSVGEQLSVTFDYMGKNQKEDGTWE